MPRVKQTVSRDCSFCEGTGYAFPAVFAKYESLEELSCPRCNGTGMVQVTIMTMTALTQTDVPPLKRRLKKIPGIS